MPARKYKHLDVNLLPKDAFSQSSVGRFLNWSLSTGRYIVVFTEMIVILTFLSRFTLDRQLSDLNEAIQKKQAILESYEEFERQVRTIQARAEFLTKIESKIKTVDLIDFLYGNSPADIVFEQLEIRPDRFALNAVSYSQTSLSNFIDTIKQDNRFTDVSLDRIATTENEAGIQFTVRAFFEGPTQQQTQ